MSDRLHHGRRSDDAGDAGRVGGGLHVGKRTRAGGALPRTTRDMRTPSKAPEDTAAEALGTARQALNDLGEHLVDAEDARAGREFERSRGLASTVKLTFARAESEAKNARGAASKVDDVAERERLTDEIDALDADIEAMRPAVDEAIRRAPPEAASIPFEAAWEPDVFTSWEEAEAQQERDWNDALDFEEAAEAAAWANATPAPLRDDVCQVDGPHSSEALTGIQLYLNVKDDIRGLATATRDYRNVGPGLAGPYRLYGHTEEDQLVYYVAFHSERSQNEWVIGPESVDAFAAAAEMYAGTAARLLPGSEHVPGSQADGADAVRDPDSVVKQEAFGQAPWQVVLDVADDKLDYLNGGPGFLNFARNARLRLNEYVKPARELADQIAEEVASGKLDHLEGRARAVEGRNAVLADTRRKLSPSARYASETLKEEGKTLAEMTEKKVADSVDEYRGVRKARLGTTTAETRALLDADSALWAKYAAAVDAGEDVMKAALRDLGQSPAVSRAIIQSAGTTNRTFTKVARWGGPIGLAIGALGAADAVVDIIDAAEAGNWHAAAGEAAGFAGGLVGGELGAMGAVWIASAILGPGAGVVIVASIIGGMVGSGLGSNGATSLVDLIAEGGAYGAGLATGLASAGGFAGVHSKDHPAGYSVANQLADTIFETDAELAKISKAIPQAQDRAELEGLQKMRLEVLARRQQMEDLLTALKLGAFDGPPECALPSVPETPQPESTDSLDACSTIDDDCDAEVD